jgi:hypothetical protein
MKDLLIRAGEMYVESDERFSETLPAAMASLP